MAFRHIVVAGGGVLGAQIAFQTAFKGFDVTIWLRSEGSIGRTEPKLERLYNVYRAEIARVEAALKAGEPLELPRGFGAADSVKSEADVQRLYEAVETAKKNLKLSLDLEACAKEADFIMRAWRKTERRSGDSTQSSRPILTTRR